VLDASAISQSRAAPGESTTTLPRGTLRRLREQREDYVDERIAAALQDLIWFRWLLFNFYHFYLIIF
jgi:hypothetical protein